MKQSKPMSIHVSIIVDSGVNFRTEAARVSERMESLCKVVQKLADSKHAIATVLFPAGYFCTSRPGRVPTIAEQVAERLDELRPPFAVIWGIDGWTEKAKHEARCDDTGYPFFVYAWLPSGKGLLRFQQIATTVGEGRAGDLDTRWNGRNVVIGDTHCALLICGECLSERLRDKVRAASPTVLLIPAHQNVNLSENKRRSWHLGLQEFNQESRIPVLLSEHSRSADRHSHFWGGRPHHDLALASKLPDVFTAKAIEV